MTESRPRVLGADRRAAQGSILASRTLAVWLMCSVAANSQVNRLSSDVGSLNGSEWVSWGTWCMAMDPDAEFLWFTERLVSAVGGCQSAHERVAGMRRDGTAFRVLLDMEATAALHPDEWATRIIELTVSGDGATIAASIPGSFAGCGTYPPFHVWLIDSRSGAAAELDPGWAGGVDMPSFSDDGERIVYEASSAIANYILTAKRSSATTYDGDVEILFAGGGLGLAFLPVLSGDGESVVFVAYQGLTTNDPGYLYRYHLPTGALVQLDPDPVVQVQSLSVSRDGSRIVYGEKSDFYGGGPLFGVSGDGTEKHVVAPSFVFDSATISRDGRWVYFTDKGTADPFTTTETWRVPWGGGVPEFVGGGFYNSFTPMAAYALSADGDLVALRKNFDAPEWPPVTHPVQLVRFAACWLTTYGPEQPGQPLHCDVGGAPGAAFTLFGSPYAALTRTAFGPLYLEPSRLAVLAQGVVDGPDNMTTVPLQVPDDPSLEGLEYHLQALVGGAGKTGWTNRTTVRIGAAP